MLTTLAGDGPGAGRHLGRMLIDFAAEYGETSIERLEVSDMDRLADLQSALVAMPLLAAKKLVVIHGASMDKSAAEKLEAWLPERADTIDVVVVEPRIDKRTVFYKWLQKNTDLHDYFQRKGEQLTAALVDYAKAEGGHISASDARYLADRVGGGEAMIAGELKKLLVHGPIDRGLIDTHTLASPSTKVFDLLEAIAASRQDRAMQIYQDQRDQKVEPQAMLAMIIWQLQLFALTSSTGKPLAEVSKEAGVGEYPLQKAASATRRLGLERIKKMIDAAIDAEKLLKVDYANPDETMRLLILQMAGSS